MAAENLIGGKPGELFTHRNLETRNYSDINQFGYLFCCVTGWGGVELNSFVCFCLIALLLNDTCAFWLLFDLKVSLAGFFLCVCEWSDFYTFRIVRQEYES